MYWQKYLSKWLVIHDAFEESDCDSDCELICGEPSASQTFEGRSLTLVSDVKNYLIPVARPGSAKLSKLRILIN